MRTAVFCMLSILALYTPIPLFLFCAFLYMSVWSGYELLVIGVCIDCVFGPSASSFLYTFSIGAILLCAEFVRPYLSWYTTRT